MLLAVVQTQDPRQPGVLQLMDLGGQVVAQTPLTQSATILGAAGGMAVIWDGRTIEGLRPDGRVEQLATFAVRPDVVAMSPDGSQFVWTKSDSDGQQSRTTVYLGARQIATLTERQPRSWGLRSWSVAGVVMDDEAQGLGGYELFDAAYGATQLLDVRTGSLRPLTDDSCYLAALAADGTVACTNGRLGGRPAAIHVTLASGASFQVPLPADRFGQAGNASFGPGSSPSELVIGGSPAHGVNAQGPEQFEMDILDLNTRSLRQVNAAGLTPGDGPWAWLPDGSFVCYRSMFGGGTTGVYLAGRDGSTNLVAPSVDPRGVIVVPGS